MNIILPFTFENLELKKVLLDFTQEYYLNRKIFSCNCPDYKRFYCNLLQHSFSFVDSVKELRQTVYDKIGISSFEEETEFGIFLGLNLEGGLVHKHIDHTKPNYVHTRINFLLSKPFIGGNPVINSKVYKIEEDQAWINLASEWYHSSSPVLGKKSRVVLSLGASVERSTIENLNIRL